MFQIKWKQLKRVETLQQLEIHNIKTGFEITNTLKYFMNWNITLKIWLKLSSRHRVVVMPKLNINCTWNVIAPPRFNNVKLSKMIFVYRSVGLKAM